MITAPRAATSPVACLALAALLTSPSPTRSSPESQDDGVPVRVTAGLVRADDGWRLEFRKIEGAPTVNDQTFRAWTSAEGVPSPGQLSALLDSEDMFTPLPSGFSVSFNEAGEVYFFAELKLGDDIQYIFDRLRSDLEGRDFYFSTTTNVQEAWEQFVQPDVEGSAGSSIEDDPVNMSASTRLLDLDMLLAATSQPVPAQHIWAWLVYQPIVDGVEIPRPSPGTMSARKAFINRALRNIPLGTSVGIYSLDVKENAKLPLAHKSYYYSVFVIVEEVVSVGGSDVKKYYNYLLDSDPQTTAIEGFTFTGDKPGYAIERAKFPRGATYEAPGV